MSGAYADPEAEEKMRLAMQLLAEREPGRIPGLMGKVAGGFADMTRMATPAAATAAMIKARHAERPADPVKYAEDVVGKLRRAVEETGSVPADIAKSGRKLVAGLPKPEAKVELPGLPPVPVPRMPTERVVVGKAASVAEPREAVLGATGAPVPVPGSEPASPAPDSLHPAIRALLGSAGIGAADPGLERAQKAASDSRLMAAITRAGGAAIGRGQGAGYNAMDEAADVPIRDYQQRRAEQESHQEKALRAAAEQLKRQDILAKLDAAKREKEADREFTLNRDQSQRDFTAEQNRQRNENILRASRIKAAGLAAQGTGKPLPAETAKDIGGIDAASAMVDHLMAEAEQKLGPASGVAQYLPGTDASQYRDTHRTTAQTVGLILEGGKLTKDDLVNYMELLPTGGDGKARRDAKAANIKKLLELKRSGQLDALGKSGYKVIDLIKNGGKALPGGGSPAPAKASGTTPSADDLEALWSGG